MQNRKFVSFWSGHSGRIANTRFRKYFWCGHRCRNAKSPVFGLDIGVKSQKRVFEPISGGRRRGVAKLAVGWGWGCGLGLGLRGGSNSALNGKINLNAKVGVDTAENEPSKVCLFDIILS